jgi:transcriptional regulator with XRE-family HTH domain
MTETAGRPGGVVIRHDPDVLRDARRGLGLSITEVARRSGRSKTVISRYERGERNMTLDSLQALARSLHFKNPADLLVEPFAQRMRAAQRRQRDAQRRAERDAQRGETGRETELIAS